MSTGPVGLIITSGKNGLARSEPGCGPVCWRAGAGGLPGPNCCQKSRSGGKELARTPASPTLRTFLPVKLGVTWCLRQAGKAVQEKGTSRTCGAQGGAFSGKETGIAFISKRLPETALVFINVTGFRKQGCSLKHCRKKFNSKD